ncbi:MAG: hypothetical protein GKR94_12755 [Gammaproteobacteria bacterium]|nr:hypothetical protein [Gammaproteobacteria bacterium]
MRGEKRPQDAIEAGSWMMQVVDKEKRIQALKPVQRNQGAAGVEGMTVDERSGYLKHHWPAIKAPRLAGTYQPQPTLRIEIPQPHGRLRQRGLPPVTDRVIQPAIAQVLRWMWEPPFHPNRYGLRRMRSAQQALHRAQSEVIKGRKWVVALDFDSVFDRVKQDRLMPKLKAEIQDKARLGLLNG